MEQEENPEHPLLRRKQKHFTPLEKALIFKMFTYLQKIVRGEINTISHKESKRRLARRLAEMSGSSLRTIQKIVETGSSQDDASAAFPPKNYRKRPSILGQLTDEKLHEIRSMIVNYNNEEKKPPTLKGLAEKIAPLIGRKISTWTMRHILTKAGYCYGKVEDNKHLQLIETPAKIVKKKRKLAKKEPKSETDKETLEATEIIVKPELAAWQTFPTYTDL